MTLFNFHASDSVPAVWGGHGFNPWNEIVERMRVRGCMGMKYLKALDIHTKTGIFPSV